MAATVRTRFAPSPSGHLHVGGARTALYCWAYARARHGRFILRIEDTDQKRSSDSATAAFMEDLAWLAIDWDEGPEYQGRGGGDAGPYYQSRRLEHYERFAAQLLERGLAYRAFETPEELAAARRQAEAAGGGHRYDRAALRLDPATVRRYLDEGRPHVVRIRAPDSGTIVIHDQIRGDVSVSAHELDDFVIVKADGFPTYHFAVVVDDELMGVTHVIRGQEHLYNTARHIVLQDGLGFRRPVYAHLSLIFNPDGSKMSKRDRDKALRREVVSRGVALDESYRGWLDDSDSQLPVEVAERLAAELDVTLPEIEVEDFRRAGYLPEVLVNYLALLGWSPGDQREKFDRDFLVAHFDLDRVIKSPARFDRDKLLAFNLDAIQAMDPTEFARRLRAHGDRYHAEFRLHLGAERFELFARCNQVRSKTLEDPFRDGRFFVIGDSEFAYEDSKAVRKALGGGPPAGYDHLEALLPVLRDVHEWTVPALEEAVTRYAEAHAGGGLGKVAQPLRVAVSGKPVSPAIFETLAILGRESSLARIERCLARRAAGGLV